MSDLFAGYGVSAAARSLGVDCWDEVFSTPPDEAGAGGVARPKYRHLVDILDEMPRGELASRIEALANSYLTQGVTFDFAGEERPFPIDPIPRVIEATEWRHIETGIAQRVRALEALLDDVYGPQRAVADGVIPAHLIASSKHYHRQAVGVHPANGVRIQVAGIDLIRDGGGTLRALEDNVRVPSGVSYVMSNRSVMAQSLPELFGTKTVRPVTEYPMRLLAALRAAAPEGVADPTVVVLTPGMYNSAYYEHALLARRMGVELVEGRDLFCTDGRVYMRTTSGPQRVDVIYKRLDDEFVDPLNFRADSVLGSPGMMLAARLGNVTIANAVGNGVADDKLMYTYVPDLIRYYLAEEPIIPNVPTWRLEEPDQLAEVLDRLDEVVVKPVDGSGGKGLMMGPTASREELDRMRRRLRRDPRGWIAQPVVMLSTIPSVVEDGVRPRHVDLRPFAVNDGEDVWVLPGGLTRVALPEGQLVVNSSQGGGSKDTWVLGSPVQAALKHELAHDEGLAEDAPAVSAPRLTPAGAHAGGDLTDPEQGPAAEPALRRQQEQEQQQARVPAGETGEEEARHAVADR
ncbi:circularly permuted type 2 ATP-grasp protein [Pseudoclavibacter caeni]|uniref:Circularly permuted type 2 ATP-grasp protein n=1 Tax=Pseudoclavibacter caeni TaxID=908846 RepID=A0A7C8BPY1_9MICO|nr:circularly permuted type 2 ATP-grasp protein [Pseudoclavibacter caeni]KAB1633785.1 circularly permuted type 2 ATP-grasp protein [Pseudoclavibacter caeni]NYJ96175.1 putative circularly permuted ATP-grasp superfamily protein [Pseudoclavibacter caeni]